MDTSDEPEAIRSTVGRFCWVELHTTDPAAARAFYGGVFGWSFEEMPRGEATYAATHAATYAVATVNGKRVAGLMPQREQAAKRGAPPSWACYIAVADVAASAEAAARLGATVLSGPTPMGPGTFAALRDPAGSVFMLWQAPPATETMLHGEPGALAWNELVSGNVDAAGRFYTQLLGWTIEPFGPGGRYTAFKHGGVTVGGLTPHPPGEGEGSSFWASYFAVVDAAATLATATSLGAKVMIPLTDIPGVGRFGWLQDPQGAAFAIIENVAPA